MGVSDSRGTVFWGPYNKDPAFQGITLGSPIFGNSHMPNTMRPWPKLQAREFPRFLAVFPSGNADPGAPEFAQIGRHFSVAGV